MRVRVPASSRISHGRESVTGRPGLESPITPVHVPGTAPPRRLDHDRIAADYQTRLDLTIGDLARIHGCSPDTIGRIVRRRGLAGTIRSSAVHDHEAIAADYAAGTLTVTSIASRYRCDVTTVYDIARARGLRRASSRRAWSRMGSVLLDGGVVAWTADRGPTPCGLGSWRLTRCGRCGPGSTDGERCSKPDALSGFPWPKRPDGCMASTEVPFASMGVWIGQIIFDPIISRKIREKHNLTESDVRDAVSLAHTGRRL